MHVELLKDVGRNALSASQGASRTDNVGGKRDRPVLLRILKQNTALFQLIPNVYHKLEQRCGQGGLEMGKRESGRGLAATGGGPRQARL